MFTIAVTRNRKLIRIGLMSSWRLNGAVKLAALDEATVGEAVTELPADNGLR